MYLWLHKLGSAPHFYRISGRFIPWLAITSGVLIVIGVYLGLVVAPPDYQQSDAYRIMFIHVPSAWMSMFIYVYMATLGAIGLIWRIKLAHFICTAAATVGASFTLATLVTGSIWGKPMWGAWWAWDARLTSELILLFLYLGFISLQAAVADQKKSHQAGAILLLAGVVNIPIIHYSVVWWNSLHQDASISRIGVPAIHSSMLAPLLIMAIAFMLFFFTVMLIRARAIILETEQTSRWAQQINAST